MIGYDRRFAGADDYTYVRCLGCGVVALDPLPTSDQIARSYPPAYYAGLDGPGRNLDRRINRLAVRYYYGVDSPNRSALLRRLFAALSGRVLAGLLSPWGEHRLLDVGCGTGAALATYQRLGWQVAGIERSPDATALARARGLRVHLGEVFDAPFGPEFDIVLLSHVIEHVRDPVAVLARAATFVAPGGKIVILTPNLRSLGFWLYGSCWFALEAPRHLFLFDPSALAELGRKADLVPVRLITRGDATVLRYSRYYARTQGAVLPNGAAARTAIVRDVVAHPPVHRRITDLLTPLSWIAARFGRGETIVAELRPT